MFKRWKPLNLSKEDVKYQHPSIVYETENMSSVSMPNVDIQINLNRLLKINEQRTEFISDVQYEAVKYGTYCLTNSTFREQGINGFLLGDGTGVGKTRTLASIISVLYNKNSHNFKCLWVSTNKVLEKSMTNELKIMSRNQNEIPNILKLKTLKEETGLLYTTYCSIIKDKTYKKIAEWIKSGDCQNMFIIFDEAHNAKNSNTLIGKKVVQLQNEVPKIGVVYSTATAASEVKQMHYMCKLGLWDESHERFVKMLYSYGTTAMELVSIQLKMDGRLVSRHLGFDNVLFQIKQCFLTNDEKTFYNQIAELWRINAYSGSNGLDHLSLYRYLITNFKVKHAISLIKKSLEKDESIVIGVQNTGEMSTKRNEFSIICDKLKQYDIDVHGLKFDLNPIDMIIEQFGEDDVAEISGRKTRILFDENGKSKKKQIPDINKEIELFQSNRKRIAIVTRSGSSGISLHSDCINHSINRRRHHIILESPWSAESLMQQIGRTHRTNSTYPPYYTFLVTDIPSEYRFFNGLAHKFENLGALTKGDKRASIFNKLHFDGCKTFSNNKYRAFHFEFNIQIAREWHKKNLDVDDIDINYEPILKGLKMFVNSNNHNNSGNNANIRNSIHSIFKKLNLVSIDYFYHDSLFNLVSIEHSSYQWRYIWTNINSLRTHLSVTQKTLFVLYKTCFLYLKKYLPYTEKYFEEDIIEFKTEHLQSKDVNKILNVLELCRLKPECSKTIGILPDEVLHHILPFLLKKNDMSNIDWKYLYKTEKIDIARQILANDQNTFFNNFFNISIKYQKVIYHSILEHIQADETLKEGIISLEQFLIGKRNEYCIKIDKRKQYNDFIEFKIDVVLSSGIDKHLEMYENWKDENRLEHFVQDKKNTVKFGVLLKSSNIEQEYEVWYPGFLNPAKYYNKKQWELKSNSYKILQVNDENWYQSVTKQLESQKSKSVKMSKFIKIAKRNALNYWNKSKQQLIKVDIADDLPFVGLVMNVKDLK